MRFRLGFYYADKVNPLQLLVLRYIYNREESLRNHQSQSCTETVTSITTAKDKKKMKSVVLLGLMLTLIVATLSQPIDVEEEQSSQQGMHFYLIDYDYL